MKQKSLKIRIEEYKQAIGNELKEIEHELYKETRMEIELHRPLGTYSCLKHGKFGGLVELLADLNRLVPSSIRPDIKKLKDIAGIIEEKLRDSDSWLNDLNNSLSQEKEDYLKGRSNLDYDKFTKIQRDKELERNKVTYRAATINHWLGVFYDFFPEIKQKQT